MNERENGIRGGCLQRLVVLLLLLWFALALIGSASLANRLFGHLLVSAAVDALAILIAALTVGLPVAVLILLLRGRPAWHGVRVIAAALLISGGYVVLDAAVRAVFPERDLLILLPNRYVAAGVRLMILLPYVVFAAWLAPRLVGVPSGRLRAHWLGLSDFRWAPVSLALAVAALVTLPWPLTGALGDSLTSLALAVQMLARVVPEMLIFWGVILHLLTVSSASSRGVAATAILIYGLSALGGFLPRGDAGPLGHGLLLVPLALLLAEIRARGRSVIPLVPLALCYFALPALFVDPRDAMANGIPELQHVASYAVSALTATVLTGGLFFGRRLKERRITDREQPDRGLRALPLVAVTAWALWTLLYFAAGEPGFFNDGFLIVLEDQVDLSSAYAMPDRQARLQYVYDTLVETAEATQGPIRRELDDLGVPYRQHYIINVVRVDGHRWLMGRFEGRPEVARVILNPNVRPYPRRIPFPYEGAEATVGGVQENLAAIGADEAWSQGVEGAGIVVGGQDTGYDWEHPALRERYRGWDGQHVDHNYNWHDAWDHTQAPFDDGSHGTHTMGTVLGNAGPGNRIGVAPGAQWIGCRNMRRGFGNPGSYLACMEFLLAPYPLRGDPLADGDVSLAADVINNSWGCPPMEGCFPGTLREGVEAIRAAGIIMVVSAGNDGPACGTATTPPANYAASFSVGATTVEGRVVGFSSRGPVNSLVKPDIAAPGERVRSSVPGEGYAYASGTSMAAPHVAGAIAVVWSADRDLIGDARRTEELLCRTAVSRPVYRSCDTVAVPEGPFAAVMPLPACACGGTTGVPNNVYGCGVVDAGAAVTSILEE